MAMIRLGFLTGFEKQFEWYDLRRRLGSEVHQKVTKEAADQFMGHELGSDTYSRYYMTFKLSVPVQ